MDTLHTDNGIAARALASDPLPDRIVVGVDGSDSSLRALDVAATVARRNHAQVTVAFVRHIPALATVGAAPALDWVSVFAPLEHEIEAAARARLAGVHWTLVVRDGSPAAELERIAVQVGGDLLVVGRSEGGRIHRLIEGSVGGQAAADAPVAVLVVR
jgi:nucleotide-binding universal stress UspA family protein